MPTNNTIALSGQFHKILVGGVDLSQYIEEMRVTFQRDRIDVTTFLTGGNPVTRSNMRGAQVSDGTINGPYDPAFVKAIEAYVGSRTGVQFKVYGGSNALPTLGDELLSGYFAIFAADWGYQTYQKSMIKLDLKIPDGASVPAVFYGTI